MELEDLLSDELLEWLGNDEPDVSDDTDIEQLLAAASDVYELLAPPLNLTPPHQRAPRLPAPPSRRAPPFHAPVLPLQKQT